MKLVSSGFIQTFSRDTSTPTLNIKLRQFKDSSHGALRGGMCLMPKTKHWFMLWRCGVEFGCKSMTIWDQKIIENRKLSGQDFIITWGGWGRGVSLCPHSVFIVFKSVCDILISVGGNFPLTLVKHFTLWTDDFNKSHQTFTWTRFTAVPMSQAKVIVQWAVTVKTALDCAYKAICMFTIASQLKKKKKKDKKCQCLQLLSSTEVPCYIL